MRSRQALDPLLGCQACANYTEFTRCQGLTDVTKRRRRSAELPSAFTIRQGAADQRHDRRAGTVRHERQPEWAAVRLRSAVATLQRIRRAARADSFEPVLHQRRRPLCGSPLLARRRRFPR